MLRLYNTLTREKEPFVPLKGKEVKMFVCGPTVYDYSHLGHARTYIAYDIIARWLRHRGYDLTYLMNVTDVDDRIINRAKETGQNPLEVSRKFTQLFHEDMKTLGMGSVNIFAPASGHIKEIIDQTERLIKKGFVYVTPTGVYFDISKPHDYGKLSHQNPEELKTHRIEPDTSKKNPQDFSLWKLSTEGISWDSPWGRGRPGWHIEDTAIAEKYLGQQYDIHGGGNDLIFPHHEAEIAQMESASGKKPFVKYWTHTGFLLVNGEKMAKSLGNFVTIRDALKKYDPEVLRLFFSFTHYRSPIDYSEKNLEQAKNSLEKLYNTLEAVRKARKPVEIKDGHAPIISEKGTVKKKEDGLRMEVQEIIKRFEDAMDDDFNTPLALAALFELSALANRAVEEGLSRGPKKELTAALKLMGGIFGILRKEAPKEEKLPPEAGKLINEREEARKKGYYKRSDELRAKLKAMGIDVQDTKEGPKWKRERP